MPRLAAPLICLLALLAPAAAVDVTGPLVAVIPDTTRPNDTGWLLVRSAGDDRLYGTDDRGLTIILEHNHKTLLRDAGGEAAGDLGISLRLTGVHAEPRRLAGRRVHVIARVDSIYPDAADRDRGHRHADLSPARPAPDVHHRFLDVPVDHDQPDGPTFSLYYELSSDHDPARPVVLIPTDGQRTLSQVGAADRYREMFGLEATTVTFEYRGMPASAIAGLDTMAWARRAHVLSTDQVVEDIECIRRDLLGDGKIHVLGGSGTAMVGLKYVAAYPQHVGRAFLMSFFQDARGSSEAGVAFFAEFLGERGLREAYRAAIQQPGVQERQLLFLIQRLLYFDADRAARLITATAAGDRSLYRDLTDQLGSVEFFIRSARVHKPWTVVFMFETNQPVTLAGRPDINDPFLRMAAPVRAALGEDAARARRFDIPGLNTVDTEILLVGGTEDPVAPVTELQRIHAQLPRSALAVFAAQHCLQGPVGARQARAALANHFFAHGLAPDTLHAHLAAGQPENRFLRLE